MSMVSILGKARVQPSSPGPRLYSRSKVGPFVLIAVFVILAVLIGMVIALDSPALVMLLGGAVLAFMLFVLVDTYGMLLSLFVMTFLIQGSLLFFLGLRSATWVAVGMALLFFARVLLEVVLSPSHKRQKLSGGSAIYIMAIIYLLIFVASMVINRIPFNQLISSIKAALPMFGVLFAFCWARWEQPKLETLWGLAVIVALVQFPVALFQNLAFASKNYDSIVGTFGGNMGGGGNSSVMVMFCIAMLTYALARWDRGLMTTTRMVCVTLAVLGVILVGEVKAAFLWLPLAAAWVLRKRIFANVLAFIGAAVLLAIFLSGTYFVYSKLYWSGYKTPQTYTVSDTLAARGGYFFDPNNIDYRTGEVSRAAALAIWSNDPQASLPRELLGYGPSASKAQGAMGLGTVAVRYAPLQIDVTALSQLLWDVGILGTSAYLGLIIVALGTSWKAARKAKGNPSQLAMIDTCVPMLLIMLGTVLYNKTLIEEPTAQLLMMFCIGTVVQIVRFGKLEWPLRKVL